MYTQHTAKINQVNNIESAIKFYTLNRMQLKQLLLEANVRLDCLCTAAAGDRFDDVKFNENRIEKIMFDVWAKAKSLQIIQEDYPQVMTEICKKHNEAKQNINDDGHMICESCFDEVMSTCMCCRQMRPGLNEDGLCVSCDSSFNQEGMVL